MAINKVRAIGDDRPWKDEVEREFNKVWDALKFGKVTLRQVATSSSTSTGGTGGPGINYITATSPATYDTINYVIGVDEDAFTHISNLDYAQFDTTAGLTSTAVGMLTWNDNDGTLEFQLKGGNVTLPIGQGQVMRVRNNTGSDLTKGTVVYISGSDGTNFNVSKAKADADATSAQTFGILSEDITTSAQHGFVTTNGVVHGVDLSYITGLTAGDILYLDGTTAGLMTRTKPSAPTHLVYVGYCLSANGGGTNSTVFIKPQNGYELDELHDVSLDAKASIADNEVLAFDSASQLWKNQTASEAGIASTTNPTISTGTFNSPTINTGNLNNPLITRDNSVSEGGQINFARAVDNAAYWYIDQYGSTTTPNLRFIESSTPRFELVSGGAFSVSGQTGSAGQVLQSQGIGSPPIWATVSGTSSNSFTTMNAPGGTDPVASTSTDTLNFANGSNISITGDSSTKTLTFALATSTALSGTPTAPTATPGDNSTQIATTAFVKEAIDNRGYTYSNGNADYYDTLTGGYIGTSENLTANKLLFYPAVITDTISLRSLSINTVSTTAGTVRLGIYTDAAGLPANLVLDAGTVSTTTAGVKTISNLSTTMNAGVYWFAIWASANTSGTATAWTTTGGGTGNESVTIANTQTQGLFSARTSQYNGKSTTATFSTFASTWTYGAGGGVTSAPRIMFRIN